MSRNIHAHKAMRMYITKDNKNRYNSMKNKAKKAFSNAMREKAEDVFVE